MHRNIHKWRPSHIPRPFLVRAQIALRQFCCQLKILSLLVHWKHHMVKCFLWCWCEWWLTWRGWIELDRPIFRCLLHTPIPIHTHAIINTHTHIKWSRADIYGREREKKHGIVGWMQDLVHYYFVFQLIPFCALFVFFLNCWFLYFTFFTFFFHPIWIK